ncbi:MAG: glutathione S-transferase [Candidatus Azotimanducaceae bacterium]|jgi:glutathione S-transferase
MSELILHQYPASPFAEKIRTLLGYKKATYSSVKIPVIMPKPLLMPLSGGYRKTPVMQSGSDVYCDSAIICRMIDRLYPESTIYPTEFDAANNALANWTDTFFFRVAVAIAFQPRALANHPLFSNSDAAAAFAADRAELSKGGSQIRMDFDLALPSYIAHLKHLDQQFSKSAFLFGERPCVADFSTYHCCWFVYNNEVIRDTFDPFPNVRTWLDRMAAFGHGNVTNMTGEAALDVAKNSEPLGEEKLDSLHPGNFSVGDEVEIIPTDYGLIPVQGKLLVASLEELALLRTDSLVGNIAVHFPRMGFDIRAY